MIVDDSPSLRSLVKWALTDAKYEVQEAIDGQDAIEQLEKGERPRLIICDVNMPRMDGLTFVKTLRASPKLKFMPVVMLTTEGKQELIEQAKAAGAKAWMVKPFEVDKLLAVVHQVVGP